MIVRYLALAILMTGLFAAPPASAQDAAKIAVVDVEKILAEGKAAKSLQTQIQSKKESFQKEFAEKEKQLKATEDQLVSQKETLSAEEFDKKRKAYEQSILDTRKLFQKRRSSLDEGLAKAMAELRKNIVEATAQIAEQKGYDIVLTRDSVIIAEKTLDITPDVLKGLDAKLSTVTLKVE